MREPYIQKRFLSIWGKFDIHDEDGNIEFKVKGTIFPSLNR